MHPFKHMTLLAVSAVGVLALTWAALLRPAIARQNELVADSEQKRLALASMTHCLESAADIDAKTVVLRTALEGFNARVPPARQANKAIEDIWRLAEGNSLQMRAIRTIGEKRVGPYIEQEIEMTLGGDFSGFYQFLLGFENAKRLSRIRTLGLSQAPEADGQIVATMNFTLYFQAEGRERP